MERNEGLMDRIARLIVGAFLLIAGATNYLPHGMLLVVLGIALMFTGVTGFCLLYKILGIKTCRNEC
ncbi:DUF2892 domain-containing protein [Ferroglobus sp.]|uniref:YgaP family membrane protein n=1 Tax=Ferroglobus sp. TaxID=2614230 RepID=UPI0025C3A194|nr:DUF2892 domain-containing protein [Ferroglobus sp.]